MTNYINNTIFTEYAIKKINNNLIQIYEDFNFVKIKISNKAGSFEYTRNSLVNTIYTLGIDNVEINDNVYTLYCTIPESIEGFDIREIGIFDTINGVDNLFTLTSVDTLKPSDLSYDLIVTLDINLGTLNLHPLHPEIVVNDIEHASITSVNNLDYTLAYVTSNLEKNIESNSEVIGYNTAQIFYKKQQDTNYWMQNVLDCSLYSQIIKLIGFDNITDCFFNSLRNDSMYYQVRNLVNYNQYITVDNGLSTSSSDKIYFNSVAGNSLLVSANLDGLSEGLILGKIDASIGKYFFSFKVEESLLMFTLYSDSGYYIIYYDIASEEVFIENNKYNTFIITFNNNFTTPELNMYINGKSVTVVDNIFSFTELTSNNYLPLTNYTYATDGTLMHNNTYSISTIIGFSKILTPDEIFLLSTLKYS